MIIPRTDSRLLNTPIVTDPAGKELYELRAPIAFRAVQGMRPVTVRSNDTLHTLAHQFYGTPALWWAIAEFNGIFDVTTELTPGREIIVPPVDFIDDFLNNRET